MYCNNGSTPEESRVGRLILLQKQDHQLPK